MAAGNEGIRNVLSEVSKFINLTLRAELLSKPAQVERTKVVELLERVYAENDWLQDEGSTSSAKDSVSVSGSLDESRSNLDSTHSDDGYDDNIAPSNVRSLKDPRKLGFLEWKHREKLFASWQKRYFVLHKNILYCFKKPSDKKQQCAFVVNGYEVREAPNNVKEASKKSCSFELVCPGKRTLQLLADTTEDVESWKEALQKMNSDSNIELIEEDTYEAFDEVSEKSPVDKSSPVSTSSSAEQRKPSSGSQAGFFSPLTSIFNRGSKQEEAQQKPSSGKDEEKAIDAKPGVDEFEDDDMVYEFVEEAQNSTAAPSKTEPKGLPPLPPTDDRRGEKDSGTPISSNSSPAGSASGSFSMSNSSSPPPLPAHVPVSSNQAPPLPAKSTTRSPSSQPLPPPPSQPLPPIPPSSLQPQLGKILLPSEDFENMFYGLWGCQAASEVELSFQRGQVIHVLCYDLGGSDDWWVGELEGTIGLVPKSYLSPAFEIVAS